MENSIHEVDVVGKMMDMLYGAGYRIKQILTVNGDPYHEDWWPTFNPLLEERQSAVAGGAAPAAEESDQIKFLSKATCNIWWQHEKIMSSW